MGSSSADRRPGSVTERAVVDRPVRGSARRGRTRAPPPPLSGRSVCTDGGWMIDAAYVLRCAWWPVGDGMVHVRHVWQVVGNSWPACSRSASTQMVRTRGFSPRKCSYSGYEDTKFFF